MAIQIDLSNISGLSPIEIIWWFFKTIGWIYPVGLFCYGLVLMWQQHVRNLYRKQRRYILLAIDVPKNNEQGPKAVEHIFNHLAGAHQDPPFGSRWWDGEIPDSFSFEIVSIGGYIQFLVHTVDKYRDLIEAIIYAQYPNAEISEVEDYTAPWHHVRFPNDKYELWGTELIPTGSDMYPIRTFMEFEDKVAGEYKDSMASMLEGLSRIGEHEQVWIQFVITPANNDWGKHADHLIGHLIGRHVEHKKTIADRIFSGVNQMASVIGEAFLPAVEGGHDSHDSGEPTQMPYMTPGEKSAVEAIENKILKIGYHVKIHLIYLAEKQYFKKGYGPNVVYGSFKQFNSAYNGFKPMKKSYTGGVRFFKKTRVNRRKNAILHHYSSRGHLFEPGSYGEIFNTEELASLYHFPMMQVQAPLVRKAEAKKAEPPISLPVEQPKGFQRMSMPGHDHEEKDSTPAPKAVPPENLPFADL
jgi:hypothetical protein